MGSISASEARRRWHWSTRCANHTSPLRFPACGSRSSRALLPLWRNGARTLAGELARSVHPPAHQHSAIGWPTPWILRPLWWRCSGSGATTT